MLWCAMSARIYWKWISSYEVGRSLTTYASFEVGNLVVRQGVRLGNDRNKVNPGVELPHELHVDWLQPVACVNRGLSAYKVDSRMSRGLNKIEARVHAVVGDFLPIHTVLLL